MPFYRQVGEIPHKRHTRFYQPDGSLYAAVDEGMIHKLTP